MAQGSFFADVRAKPIDSDLPQVQYVRYTYYPYLYVTSLVCEYSIPTR